MKEQTAIEARELLSRIEELDECILTLNEVKIKKEDSIPAYLSIDFKEDAILIRKVSTGFNSTMLIAVINSGKLSNEFQNKIKQLFETERTFLKHELNIL